MSTRIKIGSFNVRGLADPVKRKDVFEWLREQDLTIACLQDVHFTDREIKKYEDEWGGKCIINGFTQASRGVAILIRRGIECAVQDEFKDERGNLLSVKLNIAGLEFVLVTLYGPNKDDPDFYVKLEHLVSQNSEHPIIICGDWNLVLNQVSDTRGYIRENNRIAREKVLQMIESQEMLDIWRTLHPEKKEYTWQSAKKASQRGRLDFFIVSKEVATLVKKCTIKEGYRSDHKLVCLEIDKLEWKRGKGFWKLNVDLLSDHKYIELIRNTIRETVELYKKNGPESNGESLVDSQMLWEMIKLEVRGRSISYSSHKQRMIRQKEKDIEIKISCLNDKIKEEENEERQRQLISQIEFEKGQLEEVRQPRIRAMMRRARAQFYEEGEKPSQFFLNLEKKNFLNKLISRLVVEDTVIEEPSDILKAQKEYYQNLYSCKITEENIDSKFFLQEDNIRNLTAGQRDSCEGKITDIEVRNVIKGMKNGKTPGTDGFPVEFFKVFWLDIKEYLLDSLNSSIDKGEMSITQKQGIITCIPKSGNREHMKNWRPITLLNVDYKILSGVLSHRLRKVLQDIISEEQKGFLSERYIGENTRLVYDIMHYLQEQHKAGVIMLVDFEKAFDSLEWCYIEKVLSVYGFGDEFKRWCKIIYKDSKSCVINGGHFSSFFNLERGCRQGDPLSPYIFILAVEPLAMAVKNSNRIKGITVKNREFRLGQYADDTFMLLDGSEGSLTEVLKLLNRFYNCSGLKINVDKTQLAWIGCCRNSPKKLCPNVKLKWVTRFKLLGIYFNVELNRMREENYSIKLGEIEKLLKMFGKRYLSLLGKITVIKTLAIPKIIHILSVLPSPGHNYIEQLESLFKKFIWNNKRARISFEQLCRPVEDGGLKMTGITTLIEAIRISWIRRLLIGEGGWQDLFDRTISEDRALVWELDNESLTTFGDNISNPFWKEVIQSWVKYKAKKAPLKDIDHLYFPMWNSSFMKVAGIIKVKSSLQANGFVYVKDLFNERGTMLGYEDFVAKYNTKVNFVDFYSMTHSLKHEWKANVNFDRLVDVVDNPGKNLIIKITKNKKVCRQVYSDLIQKQRVRDKCEEKWYAQAVCNTEEDWKNLYSIPFNVTIESRLRSFQYQILKRSLVTNRFLFRCKITDSSLCTFCGKHEETIEHLFYDCQSIFRFWLEFSRRMPNEFNFTTFLTRKNVLLGNSQQPPILNHVCMLGKRYIYVTRCKKQQLSVVNFINVLKNIYWVEKTIAMSNNSSVRFCQKWNSLKSIMEPSA